ncbi:hypothetical protein HAV15_003947 [Penicillium sp. str. |nr:hypothetical protein HAV15_003947 [Penicillium sp. str. \
MTRWEKLGAADAWSDMITDWKAYRDNSNEDDIKDKFSSQILYYLIRKDPANNRYAQIYAEFKSALVANAALIIDNTLPDLENTFAPIPPKKDDSWLNAVLGLVALGVPTVGGKFFDSGTLPLMSFTWSNSSNY